MCSLVTRANVRRALLKRSTRAIADQYLKSEGVRRRITRATRSVTSYWHVVSTTANEFVTQVHYKLRFYCSNGLIRSVFTTGDCPPCSMTSAKYCQCKKVREVRPCNEDVFQCQIVCGKAYGCGHHKCEQVRYTRFEISSREVLIFLADLPCRRLWALPAYTGKVRI